MQIPDPIIHELIYVAVTCSDGLLLFFFFFHTLGVEFLSAGTRSFMANSLLL